MKILKSVDEDFISPHCKEDHYNKHVLQNQEFKYTEEEYEKRAEVLACTAVDNKNIFGYISETKTGKHAYCKYNKETEEFTVYAYKNNTPYTISFYRKAWRDYNGDKAIEYFGEIPAGK